jgi:transglutaminase-like putative cysteine protease
MTTADQYRPSIFSHIVSFLGPRGLITWLLFLSLFLTIATSMTQNITGLQLSFVIPVVFFALTLGWFISQLHVRTWFGVIVGVVFGLEYLLIRVGRLEDKLWAILQAAWVFFKQLLLWYWTELPPDWMLVPRAYGELLGDMGTLLTRAGYWLRDVIFGAGALDPVGSTITWGLGFWLCAYWAGWLGRNRHNPLLGIFPAGIMMGYVLSYTGANPYNLLPVLGLTLVLMALMRHYAREENWNSKGVDYSRGLWGDVSVLSSVLTILLVIMAAVVPSISFEKISDWIQEITDTKGNRVEVVADSLGLEARPEPRPPTPLESVAQTGLPRQHLIGSGPELSRMVVMVVRTGELPSMPDESFMELDIPRYYWRSITYDRYFSRGWMTSNTDEITYEAGEEVVSPEKEHTRLIRQQVQVIGDNLGGLVYVTGALVTMDHDFNVAVRPPNEVFAVTSEALEFRADSLVPVYTEEQLRETMTNYPDWIADRYLQLPDTIPDRVLELARDLTATEPTPYDRALAIEQYLREYEYTLDVPKPGTRDDIADYFLFELKKGYCDYYATAMVVLARAAGLPTRLVVGYVSGNYDAINARYVVTEADAHAWVEVYFPGVGWIEFEPTGGRPPIDRQTEEEAYIWPEDFELEPIIESSPSLLSNVVLGEWLLIFGGVILVAGVVTVGDSLYLFLRRTPAWMVSELYRRLRKHAIHIETFINDGDTPYEVLAALIDRLETITYQRENFQEFIKDAVYLSETIVASYVKIWYSPRREMPRAQRWDLAWTWWNLRWRFLLAWLLRGPRRGRTSMPTATPLEPYVERPPQTM